jgi:hypothetical protein
MFAFSRLCNNVCLAYSFLQHFQPSLHDKVGALLLRGFLKIRFFEAFDKGKSGVYFRK